MMSVNGPDLKQMSTLKMGGRAGLALFPENLSHLDELGRSWDRIGKRRLFLGRGSNVLFTEDNVDLVLIKWRINKDPQVMSNNEHTVLVRVDGGFPLPRLLGWCSAYGLSGLEELAGIPGTVGGAVAMNAGAHQTDICAIVTRIELWSPGQGVFSLTPGNFSYGYRKFSPGINMDEFLIISVEIELAPESPGHVRKKTRQFYMRKKKVQPLLSNTAGCVFKNPDEQETAGRLLDRAGLRGKTRGQVCFSSKHANFLVNLGGGTSREALELIQEAREAVLQMSGHDLEMEILVV